MKIGDVVMMPVQFVCFTDERQAALVTIIETTGKITHAVVRADNLVERIGAEGKDG